MEDHSVVDIGLRNLAVRLNDSEMNGDILNSVYIKSSIESDGKGARFIEEFGPSSSSNQSDIAADLCDKLNISCDPSNCGLLNGCNQCILADIKKTDTPVNGLNRCNIELLASQLEQLDNRTCTKHFSVDPDSGSQINSSKNDASHVSQSYSPAKFESQDCDSNSLANCDHSAESKETHLSWPLPDEEIKYVVYESEVQMPDIMRLIQKDLSEPYSIYTYRYFIHNWPKLCFLAQVGGMYVGAIVCKLDMHKKQMRRGYIAMLAVDEKYRKRRIGSNLVLKAIQAMVQDNADEVVLETEITNLSALRLYSNLGFVRDKRLFRYYLNGVDALRLKLWLR